MHTEMGQNQRRPGFLRWGEGAREADANAAAEAAAADAERPAGATAETADVTAVAPPAARAADEGAHADEADEGAHADEGDEAAAAADASPFLRDLVGAMRGVAESSRETTLAEFRSSVDTRMEELKAAATQRADDLRRRSELDLGGIGDWERSELERVRAEAEQRRTARRELLDKELAEHQGASDREFEALNARLADYERELDAFFAKLNEITDPAQFVATAKGMPSPPDIRAAGAAKGTAASAKAETTNGNGASPAPEDRLARRLAQLDEQLGTAAAPTAAPAAPDSAWAPEPSVAAQAADDVPAEAAATVTAAIPAPEVTPTTAASASENAATATATATAAPPAETSTPIVVKGLGSFGAITSFKQALERVDGIHGVTLSLGPTGDFVYRASHAGDFDLEAAIRSIEGPNAEIEQIDSQLRVTIERPR